MITWLTHAHIRLALHQIRPGEGRPLLLLHGLGEATPLTAPAAVKPWHGPIYGLDFTGHGASTIPEAGGYTAELLLADVDTALAHIGELTVVGFGLGAYIGLLLAGARSREVRGMVLCDGPGIIGGGSEPTSPTIRTPDPGATSKPDPFALSELTVDLRPPSYVSVFANEAIRRSGLDRPIMVCAVRRPPWLQTVVENPGVTTGTLNEAIKYYSGI